MTQEPVIRQAIAGRTEQRKLKAETLAAAALTDAQPKLPILHPKVPLAEVLVYRQKNPDALAKVRETLGLMARRIEAEPWSADFAHEIETKTVPELIVQLTDAAKARDAWLGTATTKSWLKVAGIAVGAASAVLAVVTAPVTPVAARGRWTRDRFRQRDPRRRVTARLARRQEDHPGERTPLPAARVSGAKGFPRGATRP